MKDKATTTMNKVNKRNRKSSKDSEAEQYYQRTDGSFRNPDFTNSSPETDLHAFAIHRPRVPRQSGMRDLQSKLNTAFDPMKDLHMWTMWRAAVNGRIVDEVKRLEKAKADTATDIYLTEPEKRLAIGMPSSYSKTLSEAPPLCRFIRLDDHSKYIAQNLVKEGQGQLKTSQFIYFGLPRVIVSSEKSTSQESNFDQQPVSQNVEPMERPSISQFQC